MNQGHALAPVLVAVDRGGSPSAVRFGAAEAVRTSRPLRLLHVAPVHDGWLVSVGRDSMRMALRRADAEVAGRVPVQGTVTPGSVLVELARAAADAALLVLEQLPASAFRRPLPVTAAALAARVDVPVAVVPFNWVERERRVVTVGLDPDVPDDVALGTAMRLARLRHAVLRVVVAGSGDHVDERLARLGGDGCDLVVEAAPARAVEALRSAAGSSDLLVLGRHRPLLAEGSRVGRTGRTLLDDPVCPVLLTPPGHVHRPPGEPGAGQEEESPIMYARVGDRIVVRSTHLDGPVRDGEVIEVEHEDGRPPYRVRWSDNGHESLFFPGPDAFVEPLGRSAQAGATDPTSRRRSHTG
jgi:hypothetical protein